MKKILLLLFVLPFLATAQISITASSTVTQNFDGIGGTATASLPTGWKVDRNNTTARSVGTFASALSATESVDGVSIASNASAAIFNFGIAPDETTSTDRAIGFLSTGSAVKSGNLYVNLKNNAAQSILSFSISYNVEKYRNGSNPAGYTFQLYYSTDGSTWTSAGSNFTSNLTADADNAGTATPPLSSVLVSNSLNLPVALAQNDNIYFAWNFSVTSGTTTTNSQALGIDNVSITANSVLPISLSTFTAKAVDKSILLNWNTASEENNNYFDVLHSADGKSFTSIGKIDGSGTSKVSKDYSFTDENPFAGTNYYKLVQHDFDGKTSESGITFADSKVAASQLSVYANESELKITLSSPNNTKGKLQVFDVIGRKLTEIAVEVSKGYNSFTLPASPGTGLHFVRYTSDSETINQKFVR